MSISYPRAKPYFTDVDIDEILDEIKDTLHSGNLVQGQRVKEFEENFAKMVGTKYAIATNSCTSALELTLKSLGIKNKKVLVPTETFVATGNSVILSDNTPVFTDIDKSTLCMSYDTIMDRMSDDVAAIIIVHMGGLITPDIDKIRDYCKYNSIHLIEDAAHAHGSKKMSIVNGCYVKSEYAGSLGIAGCFSFYPTKVMTTGEGGMITTDSKSLMEMARTLRNHGGDGRLGLYSASNDRMTEISAILGLSQLKHLKSFVDKRNYIASKYRESLSMISEIQLFSEYKEIKNSYWNFYFILNTINRKEFIEKMSERGVQIGDAYSPPCHGQPVFKEYISDDTFEVADDILSRHVSLPMYTELNDKDIYLITDIVKEVIDDCKK